jgi:CheY-like chemotaxis protein
MDNHQPLKDRHILIVEDEYFLAYDLMKRLGSAGAIVHGPAPTIEEAGKIVSETPQLDAALLDVNLRDVLVYPVANALLVRGIPFLFTTGYEKGAVLDEYQDIPQVHKPYEFSDVLDQLSKFFGVGKIEAHG